MLSLRTFYSGKRRPAFEAVEWYEGMMHTEVMQLHAAGGRLMNKPAGYVHWQTRSSYPCYALHRPVSTATEIGCGIGRPADKAEAGSDADQGLVG